LAAGKAVHATLHTLEATLMNHDELRDTMLEALRQEGLFLHPLECKERLDLATGERIIMLSIPDLASKGSKIHCSAIIEWIWDTLTQARVHTCEEDVLSTLFDQSAVLPPSQPIEIRVDVTLVAAPEWGADMSMPSGEAWHAWWTNVERQVGPCFPHEIVEQEDGHDALYSSRFKPRVELEADSGGHLTLGRLELQAWTILRIPRRFDDPDQEDPSCAEQLVDLAAHISNARRAWKDCLEELRPEGLRPS
jgi:hypothetical protein